VWREARDVAILACIMSVHQGVQNLELSETDLPVAESGWAVLGEPDSARIILAAAKIHSFDCAIVKSGEPSLDYWGRPFQVGVRKWPGGELEFRVWSKGHDGASGTPDDLVSPYNEKAIVAE
jgi:hypothetical protein